MMSWKNVRLVFLREVRDQLRDRRTLFMIAVLPMLLYPALGIGMVEMMMLFSDQPRTVGVLGEEFLPEDPPFLLNDGINPEWMTGSSGGLRVVSNNVVPPEQMSEEDVLDWKARQNRYLETANKIRKRAEQLHLSDNADEAVRLRSEMSELFTSAGMQVVLVIPEDFGRNVARMNELIANRETDALESFEYDRPVIIRNSADDKSMIAFERLRAAISNWERELLVQRLTSASLPQSIHKPVGMQQIDLAAGDQVAANVWSKIFPAMLVVMAIFGAFNPAIDLGAGEKERGTMETLLICPARRSEIVMGKFLTVLVFSIGTAILNLASMGLTGQYMLSIAAGGAGPTMSNLALPPLTSIAWVLILLLPLAALLSALCLALATFARSSKEGQYYLTPLLMVTMGLTVFCLSPAVEITPFYSVMPIVNVALLLKGMLLAPLNSGSLYMYVLPVLATSVGYSLLALWWAISLFDNEDVLFREAERFDLKLWIRHVLRDKESTPSFTEAGFCFVIIMLLQFGAMKFMQQSGLSMMQLLLVQQLTIVAAPALLMAALLTTSFRETLRLQFPRLGFLAAAIILPFVLHPLSVELAAFLQQWFFPALPEGVAEVIRTMSDDSQPIWLILLAFAMAPAICEEIAFRGFILTGFDRGRSTGVAIVLSSLAFGIMHMIPQQVFNAALLGLVLGLIAVRSRSLWPCVVFHFCFNALAVLHSRFGGRLPTEGIFGHFFRTDGEHLRYQPLLLLMSAIVASAIISWLLNVKPVDRRRPRQSRDEHTKPVEIERRQLVAAGSDRN